MEKEAVAMEGKPTPLALTLASRIMEMLRRENHLPGYHLTEHNLCQAFNVSRSPVRKALKYLESVGVVTSAPRKGFLLAKSTSELRQPELVIEDSSDEDLYLKIANDRIQGILPEEIAESDLMDRYGVARLKIQRVLNRMARELMVDRKPGRGWEFRPLLTDSASHSESYRFRMIIEPAAILEPGYKPDFDELEKCRREQENLLLGGIAHCSPAEIYNAGVHLHETIVSGANNRFLLESLRTINQMRRIVEYGTKLDQSRLHQQCNEHLVLIDLLLKGERMEAAHFLRQHLGGALTTKIGESI